MRQKPSCHQSIDPPMPITSRIGGSDASPKDSVQSSTPFNSTIRSAIGDPSSHPETCVAAGINGVKNCLQTVRRLLGSRSTFVPSPSRSRLDGTGEPNPRGEWSKSHGGSAGQARLVRASPSANPVGTRTRHEETEQPTGTQSSIHPARLLCDRADRRWPRRGRRGAGAGHRGDPGQGRLLALTARREAVEASARQGPRRSSVHDDPEVRGPPRSASERGGDAPEPDRDRSDAAAQEAGRAQGGRGEAQAASRATEAIAPDPEGAARGYLRVQ